MIMSVLAMSVKKFLCWRFMQKMFYLSIFTETNMFVANLLRHMERLQQLNVWTLESSLDFSV